LQSALTLAVEPMRAASLCAASLVLGCSGRIASSVAAKGLLEGGAADAAVPVAETVDSGAGADGPVLLHGQL
jgi:hypothetical protein